MRYLLFSIICLCCLSFTCGPKSSFTAAPAPNLPPNWPWRGVTVESKHTRADDIRYLASSGVNFVRLLIKPSKYAKRNKVNPEQALTMELAWADSLLDECRKQGLSSIMGVNFLVSDPAVEIDDKDAVFWENKKYTDEALDLVDRVARHFASRGDELAAYEVIGEPALEKGGKTISPPGIEAFYRSALAAIRKHDTKRYFLLTPGPWGKPSAFKNFTGYSLNDDKLIYGAHMYLPDAYTHQGVKKRGRGPVYPGTVNNTAWNRETVFKSLQPLVDFAKRTNALIYVGEFQSVRWAPGANEWFKDVADALDAHGWSWTMYAYKCDTDFWDPFYEVSNRTAPPSEWKLEYKGRETEQWKMLLEYFARNKK